MQFYLVKVDVIFQFQINSLLGNLWVKLRFSVMHSSDSCFLKVIKKEYCFCCGFFIADFEKVTIPIGDLFNQLSSRQT